MDRKKVIEGLENLRETIRTATQYTFTSGGICAMSMKRIDNAIAMLKEQDERYKNMVLSWLREIAINNVDCNRDMTFLDAVEDIRDRASYGLKQYFIDKQEGR